MRPEIGVMLWSISSPRYTAAIETMPGRGVIGGAPIVQKWRGRSLAALVAGWHADRLEPLDPTTALIVLVTGSRSVASAGRIQGGGGHAWEMPDGR